MNIEDRAKVITSYYRALNALMEIGTIKDISEELKQLSINASSATIKIIDYINSRKDDFDKKCHCSNIKSTNSGIKCSNCGREL